MKRLLALVPFLLVAACGGSDFAPGGAAADPADDPPDANPGLRVQPGTGGSPSTIDSKGGSGPEADSGVGTGGKPSTGGLGGEPGAGGSVAGTGGAPVVGAGGSHGYGMAELLKDRPDCALGGAFPRPCTADVAGNTWVLCRSPAPLTVSWCAQNPTNATTGGTDWCCVAP